MNGIGTIRAVLGLLVAGVIELGGAGIAAWAVPEVGEVSFVIGRARIVSGPDSARALSRGSLVHVGQVFETEDNGHIHIRFADGAFVAVRPNTRLRIEDYHYDAANPSASRVKFSLENGTIRSITGRAGEAAKNRFRLNTPIAAIGVKGTDFVAHAQGTEATRATVSSGAIVLAPLGGDCKADSLGPCTGAAARELTAAMVGRYLELRAHHPLPEVIPIDSPNAPNRMVPAHPDEPRARTSRPAGSTNGDSAVAANGSSATPAPSASQAQAASPTPTVLPAATAAVPPQPTPTVLPVTTGAAPTQPTPMVSAPEVAPVVSEVSANAALAASERVLLPLPVPLQGEQRIWWGRWQAWVDPAHPDQNYANQMLPGRELAGAKGAFVLVREQVPYHDYPSAGRVELGLALAEAYRIEGQQMTPVNVDAGRLTLDFDNRRFDTRIAVSGAGISGLELAAKGGVQADGRFYARPQESTMALSGAISSGGTQAGYAFQHSLSAGGTLNGATLWTR